MFSTFTLSRFGIWMHGIRYEMRTKRVKLWKIATLHTLRDLQHDIVIFHPTVILAGKNGVERMTMFE